MLLEHRWNPVMDVNLLTEQNGDGNKKLILNE